MRWFLITVVACTLASGCASHQPATPDPSLAETETADTKETSRRKRASPSKPPPAKPQAPQREHSITNENGVLTLTNPLHGRVASVNVNLRFVVLDFALKQLPAIEQRLGVYREGLKVGEVKVTGPERGGNIVADLVAGEVRVGDEVRPD
jgi:hypothetical protein